MDFRKHFVAEPGHKIGLSGIDPAFAGKHKDRKSAERETQEAIASIDRLQYLLYADGTASLLIVLQGLDAAGKDGVIRHLFSGMNPQGTSVHCFKQPSAEELAHDFLWRAHAHAPGQGQVTIFNRSHYEDVLVTRVHKLVPRSVWSSRFDMINDFEAMLAQAGTHILKFYLHISPDEQLERFRKRLDDETRRWKISESDYTERELWPKYLRAYEDVLERTSTKHAPWYVIPANHKWFRNLAISKIVASSMKAMKLQLPPARVDIESIRRRFHKAEKEESILERDAKNL